MIAPASSDNDDETLAGEDADKYINLKTALKNCRKYRKIIRKFKHTDNVDEENAEADEDIESKAGDRREHNNNLALLPKAAKRTRSRSPSRFSNKNNFKES